MGNVEGVNVGVTTDIVSQTYDQNFRFLGTSVNEAPAVTFAVPRDFSTPKQTAEEINDAFVSGKMSYEDFFSKQNPTAQTLPIPRGQQIYDFVTTNKGSFSEVAQETPKITAAGAPQATFNVDLSFINNPDVAGTTYARPAFFTEGELANKPLSISQTYGTTSKGQLITGYGIYSGTPTGISIFELSKIGNLNYINPQDIVSGAGKNSNAGSGGSTFYTTPSGQVIEQVNVRSNRRRIRRH